jgi:inner membrane protease subunit 1
LPWSKDSRDFGPLPLALIKGKVTHTVMVQGWQPWKWFHQVGGGLQKQSQHT